MLIRKITIKNFRSFKEPQTFEFSSNYNTFTGENNCGKSNVIRALNLFFNDFVDDKVFDSKFDMHYKTIMDGSTERTSITVQMEFSRRKDRTLIQYLEKLLSLGAIPEYDLPNIQFSYSITRNNVSVIQYINPRTGRRTQSDRITGFFKDNLRKNVNFIYIPSIKNFNDFLDKNISHELLRRIFDTWGRSRNPRAQQLKTQFEEIKLGIEEIIAGASGNVTDILREQSDQINKFIFNLPYDDLIDFLSYLPISIDDSVITDIANKGSGIQAITLYTLVRFLEKYNPTNKYANAQFIWAIEEPESFLHPKAQKNLYKALIDYSQDTQIFITTHSYNFLNNGMVNANNLLSKENIVGSEIAQTIVVKEGNEWQPFLEILGDFKPSFIPPDDQDKIYFFVEGNIDKKYILKALEFDQELREYFHNNIVIMDGGGDEIKKRARDAMSYFNLYTIVLVDGDKKGLNYFNYLQENGFIDGVTLFKIDIPGIPNPTIEALVVRNREQEFKDSMPVDARNHWYGPKILSIFDNVQESPPEGWDRNSIKNKLCEYLEEVGTREDFSGLISYLNEIKGSALTILQNV